MPMLTQWITFPSNVGHTMIARRLGMHKFIFHCVHIIQNQFLDEECSSNLRNVICS